MDISVLHWAVVNHNVRAVEYLLENGAKVNLVSKSNMTPLDINNLFHIHKDTVQLLKELSFELEINNKIKAILKKYSASTFMEFYKRKYPAFYAIRVRNFKYFKKFLDNIDVNKRDHMGNTYMHYAVQSDFLRYIKCLEEKGIDIHMKNSSGINCINEALQNKNIKILQYLLDKGLSAKGISKNAFFLTFHEFKEYNDSIYSLLAALLKNGLNPKLINPDTGNTLIHTLACSQEYEYFEKLLIKCPPNLQDHDGYTALHIAYMASNKRAIELLLKHGYSNNIRDEEGFLPSAYNFSLEPNRK